MTVDEIRAVLERALPVKVPLFNPEDPPQAKIRSLSDYILKTAEVRAELEQALHWCLEAGKLLRDEWDGIEGWEVALPRGASRTKDTVNEAKRTVRPDLWPGMQEAKSLSESLGRQIRRLELDFQAVSRAYSLLSGS